MAFKVFTKYDEEYYGFHNLILCKGIHHLRVVSDFGVRSRSVLGAKPTRHNTHPDR